ncbi:MAG: hypothetical protein OSA99_12195 [Acidimicrobiales bacterium]|nr:hypothetical protein [Acidimicrobiales bacterium]
MATYIVSYDLQSPGQDYAPLVEYLKSLPNWWHHLGSTWVVVTDMEAAELRNEIRNLVDGNDKVLVVRSASVGAWRGFNDTGSKWLKSHL